MFIPKKTKPRYLQTLWKDEDINVEVRRLRRIRGNLHGHHKIPDELKGVIQFAKLKKTPEHDGICVEAVHEQSSGCPHEYHQGVAKTRYFPQR